MFKYIMQEEEKNQPTPEQAAWVTRKCTHQLKVWQCFPLDELICQGDGQDLMFVLLTNQQMFNLGMCSFSYIMQQSVSQNLCSARRVSLLTPELQVQQKYNKCIVWGKCVGPFPRLQLSRNTQICFLYTGQWLHWSSYLEHKTRLRIRSQKVPM